MLLQPSALVKGLADSLPSNVTLYENTPITKLNMVIRSFKENIENGQIIADKLILANNAFGQRFGFSQLERTMLPVFFMPA